jgi:hypothetical protein
VTKGYFENFSANPEKNRSCGKYNSLKLKCKLNITTTHAISDRMFQIGPKYWRDLWRFCGQPLASFSLKPLIHIGVMRRSACVLIAHGSPVRMPRNTSSAQARARQLGTSRSEAHDEVVSGSSPQNSCGKCKKCVVPEM